MAERRNREILKYALSLTTISWFQNIAHASSETKWSSVFSVRARGGSYLGHDPTLPSKQITFQQRMDPITIYSSEDTLVVLEDNEAESTLSFVVLPETGRNISDYVISLHSSDESILKTTDVELSPARINEYGNANFSAVLPFYQRVGVFSLQIVLVRLDGSQYDSHSIDYTVSGVSFYAVVGDGGGFRFLDHGVFSYDGIETTNLKIFIRAQFPHNTTTTNISYRREPTRLLSDLNVEITGSNQLSEPPTESCLTGHVEKIKEWPSMQSMLPSNCSYGIIAANDTGILLFISKISTKEGVVSFRFSWPNFFEHSSMEEEKMEATLQVRANRYYSASVSSFIPAGPFKRDGGELVSIIIAGSGLDASFILVLDGKILNPILRRSMIGNGIEIVIVTPPGHGQNVSWDVFLKRKSDNGSYACPWAGEGPRFQFSYSENPIIIESIIPPFGTSEGSVLLTIHGSFKGFKSSAGEVIFGDYRVPTNVTTAFKDAKLSFQLPSQSLSSPFNTVAIVRVKVQNEISNPYNFSYISTTDVRIDVHGSIFNKTKKRFILETCTTLDDKRETDEYTLLTAHLNSGADIQHVRFKWFISSNSSPVEKEKVFVREGGQSVTINKRYLKKNSVYVLSVTVTDIRYNYSISESTEIEAVRSFGISVSLQSRFAMRTIAYPPTDHRVTAWVFPNGECGFFNSNGGLLFDWTFNSRRKTFTHESIVESFDSAGPRRFGRELVIPQHRLSYGRYLVNLSVRIQGSKKILGSDVAYLDVVPSTLKAIIGSGEKSVLVYQETGIFLDGSKSHDPDEPQVGSSGLQFEWGCEMTLDENLNASTNCPSELLPSNHVNTESFQIQQKNLKGISIEGGPILIRYSLIVSKVFLNDGHSLLRRSPTQIQTVRLVTGTDNIEVRKSVSITTGDGLIFNMMQAPYYDDIVIMPDLVSEVNWNFSLEAPAEESRTFLRHPENLIPHEGMYQPNDTSPSRTHLGIRAGSLAPNTEYVFRIWYSSISTIERSYLDISFHTARQPNVSFPVLVPSEGSTETVFTAIGSSSEDVRLFYFHFHAAIHGGAQFCIDGCSGSEKVQFRFPVEGRYTVELTLIDSRGKLVIATAPQQYLVVISNRKEESKDVSRHRWSPTVTMDLRRFKFEGDHAMFVMASYSLASISRSFDWTSQGNSWDELEKAVSSTISSLSSLYENTQPNSALGTDQMTVASSFASLVDVNVSMLSVEAVFSLCKMVHLTINQTIESERFDLTPQLQSTLSSIFTVAELYGSYGSYRSRLDPYLNDINTILLQVSEVSVPVWGWVRRRASTCGEQWHDNVGNGFVTIRSGTYCNDENGHIMRGIHSSLGWCADMYNRKKQSVRYSVTMGEFGKDYISNSGILNFRQQRNSPNNVAQMQTDVLNTTNMASHSFSLVRLQLYGIVTRDSVNTTCFQFSQDIRNQSDVFSGRDGIVQCTRATGIRYINRKSIDKPLLNNSYMEQGLNSLSNNSKNGLVSEIVNMDGLYGAKWYGCVFHPALIVGINAGIFLRFSFPPLLLVLVIFGTFCGTRLVWRRNNSDLVEDPDKGYIARDTYGRDAYGHEVFVNEGGDSTEIPTMETPD